MGAIAQVVAEVRRRGITVHEWPGWQGRGNEGVSEIDAKGLIVHHTGSRYGSAYGELVSSSQAWAYGNALCNTAGNADGSITAIASGLTWHAGSGVGPALGNLYPWRGRLNYYAGGHEIVYPGNEPMTDAQYATALVLADVYADLFGGGDLECVRGHGETNGRGGDGKWDPGFKPGVMIDMDEFRRLARLGWKAEDVALTPNDGNVRWAAADPLDAKHVETHPVASWIAFAAYYGAHTQEQLAEMRGVLAGIASGVRQLSEAQAGDDFDMAQVVQAAREGAATGAAGALAAGVSVQGRVTVGGAGA